MDTAAEPGAIVVPLRMKIVGLTTNLAEAIVMVSSWARTALAKCITMSASRAKVLKVETSIKSEWAEFEIGMMTEGRKKQKNDAPI